MKTCPSKTVLWLFLDPEPKLNSEVLCDHWTRKPTQRFKAHDKHPGFTRLLWVVLVTLVASGQLLGLVAPDSTEGPDTLLFRNEVQKAIFYKALSP